ncbi:replicative DNA helicase [Anaerocolumna xylanovorans]|uniref:Replicative DNA helicase n=1 Tax=Anaerocolumna xylanovorans DSM 12503 TaxID=1121345 RepID=A0A1M7Y9Q4_9FIRM|nr:replicative DNA helicase [Anaerocolumna xylanovorans]SHO49364.1 replicative DNA helicase [Anaerocolumna xylanovorans DSM 12503]
MDEAFIKKVLPHNGEAEQSVVGSMIMDKDAIAAAAELVTGEDFYEQRFGVLFDAILELYNEGKPVDLITLQNKLKEKEVPEELCSLEFFRDIIASVPTSANVRYYAGIVKEKSTLRQLIKVTESITNECYIDKEKLENILEDSEKKMFDILQKRNTGDFTSIRDIVFQSLESIEAAARSKGSVTGIATGFYDLDYKTAGLQPADLILIAARPSMGKTAFVLNIAEHVVLKGNVTTAIFSLEMSKDQLVKRIMSMHSKVNSQSIRTGDLSDEDWIKLVESARSIGNSNLIIDDTSSISISELRSKCRKFKLEYNLGLVIIDYLQLMTGSKKSESRQQEISEISRSLKGIARELHVPVIALSQLSRAVEQRPDKRPMLSDLRESGAIEQDADIVMFIYRDDYYNHDSEEAGISEIIIGKQRNGPTGTVKLAWQSQYTKFANLERS